MSLLLMCGSIFIAYLLGSMPFGYLAGRAAKIDIRHHGSGNIGATNVLRVLGRPWGYTVFTLDFLKGAAAVALSRIVHPNQILVLTVGVAAVIGHVFPVWLKFRGGKAVATSLGVVCALAPLSALIVIISWALLFAITRYVSVASLGAAILLPIATAIIQARAHQIDPPLLIFFATLALLICVRHRSNVARLIAGTEPRFSKQ